MSSTVKGIARRANVSAATVSLVLNGKSGISEETRSKVLQAAADLNYAKRNGKPVKAGQPRTLRFLKIARHGHTVNRDHNVFLSDYIDGLSSEASLLGHTLEVASFEGEPVENIVRSLQGAEIDGAIVLGTELSEPDFRLLRQIAVPFVIIDTFCDFSECNFVDMNNKDAVFKVVSHLVDNGFRHIGFIGSNVQTINFDLRRTAFIEVMRKFELPFDARDIVTVDSTYEGAYQDMRAKLAGGLQVPDCYFCTNDIITYGCIKALREFDIRIPQDLSIVGFDNLPLSATMDPPLTTVEVSKKKIATLAVRLLDEQIHANTRQPAVKILVGADLVVRASVVPRKAGAAVG
jgi:LacI family transcriptional regulator